MHKINYKKQDTITKQFTNSKLQRLFHCCLYLVIYLELVSCDLVISFYPPPTKFTSSIASPSLIAVCSQLGRLTTVPFTSAITWVWPPESCPMTVFKFSAEENSLSRPLMVIFIPIFLTAILR